MRKGLTGVVLCLGIFCSTMVLASPVNLPEGIKGTEGTGWGKALSSWGEVSDDMALSVAYVYDHVSERKLNKLSGKANFDSMDGKITVTWKNWLDFYTTLGGIQKFEVKGNVLASGDKLNFDDSFIWGLGVSAIIYKSEKLGVQFFADGNYRQTVDMDLNSGVLNGTSFSKSDIPTGLSVTGKWQEWQTALGVSKKFQYFIPYAGVKYSDIKATGKVSASGNSVSYSLSSKNKVGPFVGISITPFKALSIDITGRFVDETAVSAAATIRF